METLFRPAGLPVILAAVLTACVAEVPDEVPSLPGVAGGAETMAAAQEMAVLWDSGQHPDPLVSQLTRVESGFFAGSEAVVFLDQATLVIVNTETQAVRVAGGQGDGPGEFRWPPGLVRTSGGFAAWDGGLYRLTRLDVTGDVVDMTTLSAGWFPQRDGAPGADMVPLGPPRLVGGFADGGLLFRRDDPIGESEGRSRASMSLFEYLPGDTALLLFEAPAAEQFTSNAGGQMRSGGLLFGHNTYVASTSDGIVVADTDAEDVEVRARDRTGLWAFPMPGDRVAVTQEQADAVNAEQQRAVPAEIRARFPGLGGPRPHSPIASPIDAVTTDRDDRVWVRDHVLPGAEVQRWTVWEREGHAFTVELETAAKLLDAEGRRMLVRVRDLDGDRVQVRRIAG